MTTVLTALGSRWDGLVVAALDGQSGVTIARRCADLADLLATAAAGLGQVALVDADLRGLSLSDIATLEAQGVGIVGLADPADELTERRLRQRGIRVVIRADVDGATLAATVEASVAAPDGAGPVGAGPNGWAAVDEAPPWGVATPGGSGPDASGALGGDYSVRSAGGAPGGSATAWAGWGNQGPDPFRPAPAASTPPSEYAGWSGADLGSPEPAAARGRVIAVWGPIGSPGRTTVAVNLAAELAALGRSVLIVDADTYGGCVAQALAVLDEAPAVAAAARSADQGTLDVMALARLAPEVSPGLRLLTGIPTAARWPEVRGPALTRVLDVARLLVQDVVVDCGFCLEDDEELSYDTIAPRRNQATLAALDAADELIAVGGCDPVSLQRLVRGLQELGSLRTPEPIVVVNRVRSGPVGHPAEREVAAALARFAGVAQPLFVPDDPAALDRAMLEGRVLADCAPTAPSRRALSPIAARLTGVAPSTTGERSRSGRLRRRR